MRGSTPILIAGGVVFVAGFVLLRSQSAVLAAERDRDACARLAAAEGLPRASVLALRALALELDAGAFAARVRTFAAFAKELGEPLAAIALAGEVVTARTALAAHGGDRDAAWVALRPTAVARAGVEFAAHRAVFAARESGREP